MSVQQPILDRPITILGSVILTLILASSAMAQEKVISKGLLGSTAGLVEDAAGNLYGTDVGRVFELIPPTPPHGWVTTVLHYFRDSDIDGSDPRGTLIIDAAGNLYGTTVGGPTGKGTVFELSPPATAGESWTETLLWVFDPVGGRKRGKWPLGKLVMDGDGNLYGTTSEGGNIPGCNCGLVFELVKPKLPGDPWAEKVLYEFGAYPGDGTFPGTTLLLRKGVLFGVTTSGGSNKAGTVFQLVRQPGHWAETILYNFVFREGTRPLAGVIADADGNLYGTTNDPDVGRVRTYGTIFELSPPATPGDPWQKSTLYTFLGQGDGGRPGGNLWRDQLGNLYGTASTAGEFGNGTVFKLEAPGTTGGAWTMDVLHSFQGGSDGGGPFAELILRKGLLFGTTGGTAFSVVP